MDVKGSLNKNDPKPKHNKENQKKLDTVGGFKKDETRQKELFENKEIV